MEATAVLCAAIAFVLGVIAGVWICRARHPEPKPPVVREDDGRTGLAAVRSELRVEAEGIARALLERDGFDPSDIDVEHVASELAAFGADQWSRGLSDFRDALFEDGGLDIDFAGQLADQALRGVEIRRGLVR